MHLALAGFLECGCYALVCGVKVAVQPGGSTLEGPATLHVSWLSSSMIAFVPLQKWPWCHCRSGHGATAAACEASAASGASCRCQCCGAERSLCMWPRYG
jgi:hypothetical protein